MKSKDYKSIIDYAKKNKINFVAINEFKEIDAAFEFNNLSLIDTETFEIPCCFAVDRALVLCIPTPNDMTPEDTGESYQTYYDYVDQLRQICRPQYIALEGAYVKIMLWCDWADSGEAEIEFYEFYDCCNEAVKKVRKNITDPIDFRVPQPNDPTPNIYSTSEFADMYADIVNKTEFDCEIYVNWCDGSYTTNHGVKSEMYCGMRLIESY